MVTVNSERQDVVWQDATLAQTFVQGVRGGIPYANDQIAIMLRVLKAGGEVKKFADLGCGGGILTRAVLAEFPDAHGVLIDFSEPMLETAKRDLREFAHQLEFVASDLATNDWTQTASGTFDAVVSGFAIHHLTHERKRALYGEIFAKLNRGGWFINIEHVKSSTPWVEELADELLIDSLYAFHQRSGNDRTRNQVADEFVHRPDKVANILAPIETQTAWLREIGFQDVDIFFKVFELAVFGGRRSK